MGRFYKTVKPEFLDYMYELPKEEMLKAVATADQQIGNTEQANADLQALLKLQAIDKDNPRANEILEGYEGEIQSIAEDIQKDPLKYRKSTLAMNDLKGRIHEDFTRGEAFRIQSNYDTRKANYDAMREAQIKDPEKYSFEDVNLLQQQLDENYQGYASGDYNIDRLREFVDINDMDKFGKGYAADVLNKYGAYKASDGFLYTDKDEQKSVNPEQIKNDLVDIMLADRKLMDYYDQQISLGKMDHDELKDLLLTTADRIGEKYGFLEKSKGRTSIKNDSKDVAIAGINRQYMLDNPVGNTTLGKVLNTPVIDRWSTEADGNGNTIDNYSIAGVNSIIEKINNGILHNAETGIALAQKNNIEVTDDMKEAILKGDFSVLLGAQNDSGGEISPSEIYNLQQQHNKDMYDKNLLEAKKRQAQEQEAAGGIPADQWLANQKGKSQTIESEYEFTTFGVISEEDLPMYNANIKAQQKEIHGSKAWWGHTIEIDQNSMNDLPPDIYNYLGGGTRTKFTINELIRVGIIKQKQKQIGEDADFNPEYENTKGYSTFEVNGNFAKPAGALDGDGKIIMQAEMIIDNIPIKILIPESSVSNKSNLEYMDTDKMAMGYEFNKAVAEGVIDEEGYMISGQVFYKDGSGRIVASTPAGGVESAGAAVSRLGVTNRLKREQFFSR